MKDFKMKGKGSKGSERKGKGSKGSERKGKGSARTIKVP